MDSFGWENPVAIRAGISLPPTSVWSNHYNNNLNDKSALLNSTDAFLSSSSELQRILAACQTSSNFDTVRESISTNNTLDQDLLQYNQEAILAADSLLGYSATLVDNTFSPHQLHASATLTEKLGTCQDIELQAIGNMINSQGDISALFSSCRRGNISSSEYSGSQNLEDVASQGSSKLEATRHVEPPRGRRKNSSSSNSRKRKLDCDDATAAIVDGSEQHICSLLELNSSLKESGFQISFTRSKRAKSEGDSMTIDFIEEGKYEPDNEAIAQVKEMIYRAAALRPVSLAAEAAAKEKPKRKNVRISSDPQTVAARQRRERVSERLRVLQRLVPGGTKLDTASMLEEAANYLKFLKAQVKALQNLGNKFDHAVNSSTTASSTFPLPLNHAFDPMQSLFLHPKP